MKWRQRLAVWGEDLACAYLVSQGYRLFARNVRTPYGEIDLIVRGSGSSETPSEPGGLTVFVEVKTRSSTAFGNPEQAVTASKRAHLLAAAQEFMRLHPELEGGWRVDVIAILRAREGEPPEICHFENAVTADQP